jgi:hypothetical protein
MLKQKHLKSKRITLIQKDKVQKNKKKDKFSLECLN